MKILRFMRRHIVFFSVVTLLILVKVVWVTWACWGNGTFEAEKSDILQRRNWLIDKIVVEPQKLLDEMPESIGEQFQGEWALYSCSMLTKALANIAGLYPETREKSMRTIDSLIQIVQSPELRRYDKERWGEDPLETLDGDNSHVSHLSHLAWMIGNYKRTGGGTGYDVLYDTICSSMNRRIRQNSILNIPTYPNEPIYVPDMMVALVALSDYAQLNDGNYSDTVNEWLSRAKTEWLDDETGLLVSFLDDNGKIDAPVKGSYSALNCYYLTLLDPTFARSQYDKLKRHFAQRFPVPGIKEYADRSCWFGMDIDAGPILLNISPGASVFAIGPATYFGDNDFRSTILRSAEIAAHTVKWGRHRHYLLSNVTPVADAIALAMKTNHPTSYNP